MFEDGFYEKGSSKDYTTPLPTLESVGFGRESVNIFCKTHSNSLGTVLAACDKGLLGKTLKEGKYCFEVRESFYKGSEVSSGELAKELKECSNINLVGEECIRVALKEKLGTEKSVIRIAGVPHLQIFKV